ncbi:Chitin-binding type 1 [Macrophomina phaseolina MS6]|uniref:Chitin-binding type 1 n=1 Tax=Macrophomina phaseolina (strain MS6) TaxID=1126212 RepID=K2RWK6_MACPH|nr:Chitin-binding type 1 [Macrophomina phaseolina MS6]
MFSGRLVSSLALSLALLPAIVQAHEAALLGDAGSPALRARFSLSAKSNAAQLAPIDSGLDRRQAAGSSCGPNAGGAVCGPGLCCSANGVCGVGRAYCDAPDCLFEYGPACDANAAPSGASTSAVPRPRLGSVAYGGGGYTQCTKAGTLALTYDDGPYIYTSELLDILKANAVPATFFVTGVNLGKGRIDNESLAWPGILRRMVREGHQVASHTWSHQNLNEITSAERFDQLVKNEMAFRNVLGYFPTYMRPPYNTCLRTAGCVDDIEALGYHVIKWNLDTLDYQNLTPDLIQNSKNIVSNALRNGDPASSLFIVGDHDIHPQTVRNLTQFIINEGKRLGYRFVTVGECLGDPAQNWYRDPATGGAISASATVKRSNAISPPQNLVERAGLSAGTAEVAERSTSGVAESGSAGLIALGKMLGAAVSLINVAFVALA